MAKYQINLFDTNFIDHCGSSVVGKTPKNFDYLVRQLGFDGITIYTEQWMHLVTKVRSKYNVAWQLESPAHSNFAFYHYLKHCGDCFDLVLTYDQRLIDLNPKKFKRTCAGGTVVKQACNQFDKKKLFAVVHSGKNDAPNHLLRSSIPSEFACVEGFGTGFGSPFKNTDIDMVYRDYAFAIIVENMDSDNYFSEKLTDAIMSGCIPIYKGCKNLEMFNPDGVLVWNTINELSEILQNSSLETYRQKLPALLENIKIVERDFYTTEDWLFEKYLTSLI